MKIFFSACQAAIHFFFWFSFLFLITNLRGKQFEGEGASNDGLAKFHGGKFPVSTIACGGLDVHTPQSRSNHTSALGGPFFFTLATISRDVMQQNLDIKSNVMLRVQGVIEGGSSACASFISLRLLVTTRKYLNAWNAIMSGMIIVACS